MALMNIPDFSFENVSFKFTEKYDENSHPYAYVAFNGEIDMQDPDSSILPFFESIHNEIIKNEVKLIQLDFVPLKFLNSSGIKVLIKWVQSILVLPADKSYKVEILAKEDVAWQSNCLSLMSLLAPQLITIKFI